MKAQSREPEQRAESRERGEQRAASSVQIAENRKQSRGEEGAESREQGAESTKSRDSRVQRAGGRGKGGRGRGRGRGREGERRWRF